MANPSKRKGSAFERAVADYLATHGFPNSDRMVQRGANDVGDISGVPGVTIECKAEQRIALAAYMNEVEVESANAGTALGVAVVKRRQRPVKDAYVVMSLTDFCDVIRYFAAPWIVTEP